MHGDLKNEGDKIYSKKKVQIFHYYTITALGIFRIVGALDPTLQYIPNTVMV